MPPLAIAGVAAAAVAAGGVVQGIAQSNAAKAERDAALQQQGLALGFAAPTQAELKTLQDQINLFTQAYSQSQGNLEQLEKQFKDVYGEATMLQGQKLIDSLRGAPSAMAKSYQEQRARQRTQLEQQLTSQLGPGALTSSIGQQALNNFDYTTSSNYAAINEQGLNNELNRLGSLNAGESGMLNNIQGVYRSLDTMLGQIQQTQGNFQTRQANAAVATGSNVINTAGADSVLMSNIGGAIAGAGKTFGMAAAMGGGGNFNGTDWSRAPIQSSNYFQNTPQQQNYGSFGGDFGGSNNGMQFGGLTGGRNQSNFGGFGYGNGSGGYDGGGFGSFGS